MRKYIIFLALILTSFNLFAQSFQAYSSKTELGKSEKLQITFSLKINSEMEVGNIQSPSFGNFRVVAGPSSSTQSSYSFINGKQTSSKTVSISYFLKPKSKGEFTIGAASVKVNGKIYRTNPIKIKVVKDIPIGKNTNSPIYQASKNIHLVLSIPKKNLFVGEQIVAEYKLYFGVDISSPNILEYPTFEGIWKENVKINERGYNVKNEEYKGRTYRSIVLNKIILIPQKSGKIKLPPMQLEVSVRVPTGNYDFFGQPLTKNYDLPLKSKIVTLNVKPLPTKGKPKDFSGAVGDFNFFVKLNKNNVETNRSVQLDVTVRGKGNFKLFELPTINTPNELEKYDPKTKSSVQISHTGLQGSIKSEYLFVPRYKGTYKIPNINFSYFNPQTKKYVTLTKKDLSISVTKGKDIPKIQVSNSEKFVNKEKVNYIGKDILYIKQNTNLQRVNKNYFAETSLYNILFYLPFGLGLILYLFLRLKNKKTSSQTDSKKASRLAQKKLKQAKLMLTNNNSTNFYLELEKALFGYLLIRLSLSQNDLNKEYIQQILQSKNINKNLIHELVEILNDCEFARYTPMTNSNKMIEEYQKAKNIILSLEKNIK